MGGLGNQMFQYAAARSLSIRKKKQLYLDHSFLEKQTTGLYTERKYELNAFNIKAKRAQKAHLLPFLLIKKYTSIQPIIPYTYFKEPYFNYSTELIKHQNNIYMDGYWQTEKYCIETEKQIRDEFQFVKPLAGKNKVCAEQITNCNSVAVHIRRGDYVANQLVNSTHGTCSIEYYQNAINLLKEKIENLNFFFFSDDPQWATQNFGTLENSYFINNNNADDSYYDLHLMSLCNHFIIANSSFSWWGAWLGKYANKIVIAPEKWLNSSIHNTNDVIPSAWIKL